MTATRLRAALLRFAAWPERHRRSASLLLALLAGAGSLLATQLPARRYASAAPATLQVRAELPGIDASTVRAAVTEPLEQALRPLAESAALETRTREGRTELRWPVAANERERALAHMRAQVSRAAARLPATMAVPVVEVADPLRPAAAIYAITADELSPSVMLWAERGLAMPLRELPAVASVLMEGVPEPEILIQPDARRLAAFGLSFEDLIQALRRQDQAPRSKRARRAVVMPGNVEAIAARAVRLPSGEPIALAEVARVSVVQNPASRHPRYGGAPALLLSVYPRTASDAGRIGERAEAHLAWLRANDLIPPEVVVHLVHDESRATKQWLKQVARRAALFVAISLVLVGAVYGLRRCGLLACAHGVWLPLSAALLWLLGFTLNAMTLGAWMLACVPFTLMLAGPRFGGFALFAIAAAVFAGLLGLGIAENSLFYSAFAIVLLAGVLVVWLLTPWLNRRRAAEPPLLRRLPKRWQARGEALALAAIAGIVLVNAWIHGTALSAGSENKSGDMTLRVSGNDMQELIAVGDELSQSLATSIGADNVAFSAARVATWRLQLDSARMEDVGIGLAEIGRALAIARDGLAVGEIAHGETLYRLRLQLPSGAAGEQFERLVLRGEQKNQPVVYLRDLGLALREIQPRELLQANGVPVVEITGHWHSAEARSALQRFCQRAKLPRGYKRECRMAEAFGRGEPEKDF